MSSANGRLAVEERASGQLLGFTGLPVAVYEARVAV